MNASICPICSGRGKVPCGYYNAIGVDSWTATGTTPELCKSCFGRGVVWPQFSTLEAVPDGDSELVALRKRVDATEQRLAELERRGVSVYPASKDKPHNPTCLCKDCHEDKQPAPLPPFQEKTPEYDDTTGLQKHYEDVKSDKQRIRMLVDGVKTITEFWNPHGMAALNALIQRAGCDKI